MSRSLLITALGLLSGYIIGIIGVIIFIAGMVRGDRAEWDEMKDRNVLQNGCLLAITMAVNGAIGALYGWKTGSRRAWLVSLFPLLLFILPLLLFAQAPSDSKAWGAPLLLCIYFATILWVAGRIGQAIGVLFVYKNDKTAKTDSWLKSYYPRGFE